MYINQFFFWYCLVIKTTRDTQTLWHCTQMCTRDEVLIFSKCTNLMDELNLDFQHILEKCFVNLCGDVISIQMKIISSLQHYYTGASQ